MKKLVRTNLTNTPNRRGTKDLNIQFYSHDKNNAGFEFVVKNETDLTQYTPKVLFKFRDSNSTWQSNGTVEGNIVKVNFNTDLIARCEEVLGFLFLDSDSDSLDVFKFKFNVVLSEIDKNEVEKRRIKHIENIESLEIVTRAELKDYLAKLQISGGVDLSNYLTTTEAEKIYATKNEIPSITGFAKTSDITEAKKSVIEEVKKLGYAKTTEVPAAYNDSELSKRVTNLETKVDKDTIYDDSDLKSRVQALENRPTATNATYDDSEVKRRLTELEERPAGTSYDDSDIKARVKKIEDKPGIDASNFITEDILTKKHFISESDAEKIFLKKVDVPTPVNTSKFITDDILTAKNFVTKDELNTLKPNQTLSINNNILSIAGGNSVTLPTNQWEIHGTGMPNGVITANIGTTYVDENKTNGALKWIKTTDGGNRGWQVFTGDTGWRTLPLVNKRGNARLQIRRINDEIIVKFDGLQYGWFGVDDLERQGGNIVEKTIASKKYTWIKLNIGQGNNVLPVGFRSASSLLTGLYGDLGDLLGSVYVGGTSDSNAVQLRYAVSKNELTSTMLSQIRISPIIFITDDEWPTQLP